MQFLRDFSPRPWASVDVFELDIVLADPEEWNSARLLKSLQLQEVLDRAKSPGFDSNKIQTRRQGTVSQVCYKGKVAAFTGKDVAVKVFSYGQDQHALKAVEDFEREKEHLESLAHPSIINFIDFIHDPSKRAALLYMEWVSTQLSTTKFAVDLDKLIKHSRGEEPHRPRSSIPEPFIWHVFFHVGAALALCHHGIELHREFSTEHVASADMLPKLFDQPPEDIKQLVADNPVISWTTENISFSIRQHHKSVLHRDIKPENILLSDPPKHPGDEGWKTRVSVYEARRFCVYPTALLGDFGLSVGLQIAKTMGIGTFAYLAPEVPIEMPRDDSPGFKWSTECDIFSVGATVWSLMSLEDPPSRFTTPYVFRDVPGFSDPLRKLMHKCLSKSPKERPTALDILSTCIDRAYWLESYVSPYGMLVSPDFHTKLSGSWRACLNKRGITSTPIKASPQPPQIFDNAYGFIAKSGPLALFIAAAYHDRLFYTPLSHTLVTTLADRILSKFVTSSFEGREREFLPEGYLEELINRDVMLEEFMLTRKARIVDYEDLITWVLTRAKRIFAIAVLSDIENLGLAMTEVMNAAFDDTKLPIEPQAFATLPCFPEQLWGRRRARYFLTIQWSFLAPVFDDSRQEYRLLPQHVLPFTHVDTDVKEGAFSQVYQVEIHPAHQTTSIRTRRLAVKRMAERVPEGSAGDEIRDAWERESKALAHINRLNNFNFTRFVATFSQNGIRYIILEWAEGGSLRDFWEMLPQPRLSPSLVKDVVQQLHGLTKGLMTLHENSIRHGDLKPENILRFMEPNHHDGDTGLGSLKISDMGLAKHHYTTTTMRRGLTRIRPGTTRYEAPEVVSMEYPRSRSSDIWSMGCVYLELLIWLLYGNEELIRFNKEVQGPLLEPTPYFELDVTRRARLHHTVAAWIHYIKSNDPECNRASAISDLLNIVESNILVNYQTRVSTEEVVNKLRDILGKGEGNQAYLCTGNDRTDITGPPGLTWTPALGLAVPPLSDDE